MYSVIHHTGRNTVSTVSTQYSFTTFSSIQQPVPSLDMLKIKKLSYLSWVRSPPLSTPVSNLPPNPLKFDLTRYSKVGGERRGWRYFVIFSFPIKGKPTETFKGVRVTHTTPGYSPARSRSGRESFNRKQHLFFKTKRSHTACC